MRPVLRLALIALLLASGAKAQTPDCPSDPHTAVDEAARSVEAGDKAIADLNPLATTLVRGCPGNRALYGHILAMFTRAGLAKSHTTSPAAVISVARPMFEVTTRVLPPGRRWASRNWSSSFRS